MHFFRHSNGLTWAGVCALLLLHAGLALWAVSGKSVTADEILHVTSGYYFNRHGDYRVQPENGNLPQRLAGLPAALTAEPAAAVTESPAWRKSDSWGISQRFFYGAGLDHWPLLMAGRGLMLVFSAGTGLLVFWWARRLAGPAAGLFALALYALDPNVLAHAPLATSDSAAVFLLLASATAFGRMLGTPGWRPGLLSAVVFGLACVAKFSAVLLGPVFLLLSLWRLAEAGAGGRLLLLRRLAGWLPVHVAAAGLIIWAFYGFRFSGFSPGLPAAEHYIVPWERVLPLLGWQAPLIGWLREWQLLPEAFLYGYSWVVVSAQQRAAFLAGEYGTTGWLAFFPLAFWWKSTLALLVALVTAAWLWARRTRSLAEARAGLSGIAPLAALSGLYAVASLLSHLNIGHRHLLPVYPALYILAGTLAGPWVAPRLRLGLVAVLLAGQAAAGARIAPHYLAFFNTLAGGPANGWRLLVDSSLDWGQDLPGLKAWLARHHADAAGPVYLAYFGSGRPDYYGIRATRLPEFNRADDIAPWYEPAGGLYCLSATLLQQVYSPVRGEWTLEHEKAYQDARLKEPLFREYWRNPATRREVIDSGAAAEFEMTWQRYDQLRFARLCHYLRARGPDAMVGYSILVFRLDDAEVARALHTPYSEWRRAVAAAGGR
jgi:hypothetical protein